MLEFGTFNIEMNRLGERFPQVMNRELLKRTYGYVENLPREAFETIINDFLDTFRQAPLPLDFQKAANDWRRQYFLKTGVYFAKNEAPIEVPLDCAKCQDLGIVKAKDDKLLLFRCTCERGSREITEIPIYQKELKQAYESEPCPSDWFKPKGWDEGDEVTMGALWKRVDEWKLYLKKSEAHWNTLGYEYAKSSDRYGVKQ